ncbi:MAG: hypothetical protein JXB07_14435 [Anaerolineae bacterium]|nr:hypothetical protein [Anaerolineae bacterium]
MLINRGVGKLRGRRLAEVVVTHVDDLIGGQPDASGLLAQHPDEAVVLEEMFRISEWLHKTLVPVSPRRQFVAKLKMKLQEAQASSLAVSSKQDQCWAVRATKTVGILLSIVALAALITRVIGVIIVIVTFLNKRYRSTAPA